MKESKLVIEPRTFSVLIKISNFLSGKNIKAYLVGGFVRDVLLGRETADIDLALAADALDIGPKIASLLGGKYVPLDELNRVSRIVLPELELDLSTIKDDINQDLAQRDFTIDAIALDLAELGEYPNIQLIDPVGGRNDLRRKVVRATSEDALKSDAVRLLRAVRLAAELGFNIDKETEDLIMRDSPLISAVAGERIREELLHILAVPQSEQSLPYLDELSLLTAIIPELSQTKGTTQPKEHHWDVFNHSIHTVAATDFLLRQGDWEYASKKALTFVPWSPALAQHFEQEIGHGSSRRLLLKLAALLHDTAKPQTKTVEVDGRVRFLGHPQMGAEIAAGILKRLRFSAKETKLVEAMVKYHLRPTQMSQEGLPSPKAIYRYFRDTGEAGIDTLFLSMADHLATRGPNLNLTQWQEHAKIIEYALTQHRQQESRVAPTKLIDGHDLINIFGMKPGPKIGELLEATHEAQAAGELKTREAALSYIRKLLIKESKQD